MSKTKLKEIKQLLLDLDNGKNISKETIKSLLSYVEKDLKPIKPRSAKNKGKGFQNMICEMISKALQIPWGTNEDFDIQSRQMGQRGVDVILLNKARQKFPFSIECKNTESFSLISTIHQAKENIKPDTDWIIFYKSKKLSEPIAILDAEKAINKLKED